ncbi:MAG: RNA recognition motif domain-containing protein, partial [Candidatus Roizmanbacteria bacterium]
SIHVGNIPKDSFYDLDLYKVFQCKGYPIVKSKVVLDRKTSKGLGYGYISFHKQEDAEKCLKEMNNYVINGHAIILSMQQAQN